MKAVLISIKPRWVEKIASGKKTVEVRKTKPKIDVPFKCYIYETKGKLRWCNKCQDTDCERPYPNCACWEGQGKVIGEFVCRNIDFLNEHDLFEGMDEISNSRIEEYSCLDIDELLRYKGDKQEIYAWHITDLVIYDKPKELSEFRSYNVSTYIDEEFGLPMPTHIIKRPFQSWGYVYEVDT